MKSNRLVLCSLLGVKLASARQDFGGDGDGAVDGVADDEDVGFGAEVGDALDQALDDAGVDLEEVVAGHAGFPGDTSRDEDDVATLQAVR